MLTDSPSIILTNSTGDYILTIKHLQNKLRPLGLEPRTKRLRVFCSTIELGTLVMPNPAGGFEYYEQAEEERGKLLAQT